MYKFLVLLLLGLVVLALGYAVYLLCRSWKKITLKRRIAILFLLAPHFLFLLCIALSLACGHPPPGSPCFNRQFVAAVLLVFILPVPTLVGTPLAFVLLKRTRTA